MKTFFHQTIKKQNGQAIFEMILFLPFLMFLYTIYYTAGNSISGSINQQKAVRGYFYALVKGNSYINTHKELKDYRADGVSSVGFAAIGWLDHGDPDIPIAPCFQFSSFLKSNKNEKCDSGDRPEAGSTSIIRLFTVYGVCGPLYTKSTQDSTYFDIDQRNQAFSGSCKLGNN